MLYGFGLISITILLPCFCAKLAQPLWEQTMVVSEENVIWHLFNGWAAVMVLCAGPVFEELHAFLCVCVRLCVVTTTYFLISCSWKYLQSHHEEEISTLHKTLISAETKWCLSLGIPLSMACSVFAEGQVVLFSFILFWNAFSAHEILAFVFFGV